MASNACYGSAENPYSVYDAIALAGGLPEFRMETYASGIAKSASHLNDWHTGRVIYWFETGGVQSEGHMTRGLKTGPWKYYHPNGKIERQGVYVDGFCDGEWRHYYDNDAVNIIINFSAATKSRTGHCVQYYPNGRKRCEGDFMEDAHIGEWIFYHDNGIMKVRGSYALKPGSTIYTVKTGTWYAWYDNGAPKYEENLVNGKQLQDCKYWLPDGTPWMRLNAPDNSSSSDEYKFSFNIE